MLDVGMVTYVAFIVLVFWRFAVKYEVRWYLNYMVLLYMTMAAATVYCSILLYLEGLSHMAVEVYPEAVGIWSVKWLKPVAMCAPPAVAITIVLGYVQTHHHIMQIQRKSAEEKHDRAVQLIAIPTIYAVMSLASMIPVLHLVTGHVSTDMLNANWYHPSSFLQTILPANLVPWELGLQWATWGSETCMYVADLFEAWALFQFGRLVLGHIEESIAIKDKGKDDEESRQSLLERELVESHKAVSSLTWIGTSLFVACCIVQSAFSLWPYMGGSREHEDSIMLNLSIAGNITSFAAIYNLIIVEHAFSRHLASMSPVLKFVSVKLLLSLSFMQQSILSMGRSDSFRPLVSWIPLVGGIVEMSEIQSQIFFPCLVIFECLLVSLLHLGVWRSEEEWYCTVGTENERLAVKK